MSKAFSKRVTMSGVSSALPSRRRLRVSMMIKRETAADDYQL